jgi:dTDP-4-amino-4,6-dideoxygalactose transaminase
MRERNIGVNVHYIPIYRFSYYQEQFNINPSDFPVTEEVFSNIVTLPLFPKMEDEEVEYVINTVKETIAQIKKAKGKSGEV